MKNDLTRDFGGILYHDSYKKKKMVLFSMLCLFLVACETHEHKHYCMIASGGILALTLSFQWPQPELKTVCPKSTAHNKMPQLPV